MTPTDIPVVRRATVGDEEGIARVHVDAWRESYAGIVPAEFLASLSYEGRQEMWEQVLSQIAAHQMVFVAQVPGDGIVGFASGLADPGISPRVGRLTSLYLLRAWQNQGLGRALFTAVAEGLGDLGAKGLTLEVLAANPSRGFYERMGGRAGQTRMESIGGSDIEEVEYIWDHLPIVQAKAL